MNVQEVRDHVRIQEWVELIKERSASGMTIRDWCESKGLSENQYYYWLRKIRKTACTALESRSDLTPQIKGGAPCIRADQCHARCLSHRIGYRDLDPFEACGYPYRK